MKSPSESQKAKALLAVDAGGTIRVLATDNAIIFSEFEHYGTDAEEIGIVDSNEVQRLALWEGDVIAVDQRGYEDLYPEWVLDFTGTVTELELYDERLPSLFAMEAPYNDEGPEE